MNNYEDSKMSKTSKKVPKVFESEYKFCLVLWECEPMSAADLSRVCKDRLQWSRTTTYTVIKKLGDRGILENKNGSVRSLVTKDEVLLSDMDELMEKRFLGSVPTFIATFAKRQNLSEKEIEEIKSIIENSGKK
jgi:predicted transcriptional regulator